jgi:hypothetical protein
MIKLFRSMGKSMFAKSAGFAYPDAASHGLPLVSLIT